MANNNCNKKQRSIPNQVYEKLKNSVIIVYETSDIAVPPVVSSSSGFLIDKQYVVVAAHTVFLAPGTPRVPPPPPNSGPVRKNRIWVQVFNVNNTGAAYVYETQLVGGDGALDVAVLYIDPKLPWNKDLPIPKNEGLKWGKSRTSKIGDSVYFIGESLGFSFRSFSTGIISNNKLSPLTGTNYQSPNFLNPIELVQTTGTDFLGLTGSPIVDNNSQVIGLLAGSITNSIYQLSAGTSQHIAEPIINDLIAIHKGTRSPEPNFIVIDDPVGKYLYYVKGYLGLGYVVRYDSDFTGGATFPLVESCTNEIIPSLTGPILKESIGIIVTSVDGDKCPPAPSSTGPSPFLDIIERSDLITHITFNLSDKSEITVPLGNISPQRSPTNVTFFLPPGHEVTLTYYKFSQNYGIKHKVTKPLDTFPPEYNYTYGVLLRV